MHRNPQIARRVLLTRATVGAALLAVRPAWAQSLDRLDARMQSRERYFQALDEAAPEFALQDTDGRPITLAAFRRKIVVLTFIYTL